ncbi:MAG TPA: type 2 lanthipeptide synthetase LanM family protein [Allocoleopsis sp.]
MVKTQNYQDRRGERSINPAQSAISTQELISLTERALSLDELADYPAYPANAEERKEAQRLLTRWEGLIKRRSNDKSNFDRRLALMGLTRETALNKLQTQCHLQPEDLPDWAIQLGRILNQSPYPPSFAVQNLLAEIQTSDELQFPEFLHPFISYYLDRFTLACPDWRSQLEPSAIAPLVRDLLSRLSTLCGRTVAYEVKHQDQLRLLTGETTQERYQDYVSRVLGTPQGLFRLLCRYPVLGRLLTTVTNQAIQNSVQWLQRLIADCADIATTFGQGKEPGKVAIVQPGLSDPHAGGQTVWFIQFASGLKLAYKPRSLAIDVAYHQLLEWLARTEAIPLLKAAPVLARQGYGWVGWVEAADCQDHEQVAQFYQRQGAHLALFYMLRGNDFHEDNFIAAGAFPIPIDLETIGSFALSYTTSQEVEALPTHWKPITNSVVFTSMLPRWQSGNFGKEVIAMAGIAGRDERQTMPTQWWTWQHLGTTQMGLKYEYVSPRPATCLPKLAGRSVGMQPFLDQVLAGFTCTYKTFLAHQEFLLSEDSPLAAFQDLPTRVLVRNTEEYARLLFWLTAPDNLTSGKAYDVALEMLCDGRIDREQERQPWFKLLAAEKQSLWQQDIPYFEGSTSGCYLMSQGRVCVASVNEHSSYELIQQQIKTACELDLDWQMQLIRASLEMFFTPSGVPLPIAHNQIAPKTGLELDRASTSRIREHLNILGETFSKLAVTHRDGISWLTIERKRNYSSLTSLVNPVPWSSVGAAGTAVFLANLAAYMGNSAWATLAVETTKTAAMAIRDHANTHPFFMSPHLKGCNGLAMVIYALLVCCDRLGDRSCLELARDLIAEISIEEWGQVIDPDFLNGSASALLTLVQLYQHIPDPQLLERAQAVANGILMYQVADGIQAGGFKVPIASRPLLGMAHGTAGIAYALFSLYRLTNDRALKVAICKALAYERSHYDREHQDWRNLQHTGDTPSFMTGWCAGAPGIGLARLAMLDGWDDGNLMPEIHAACQATLRHVGLGGHHLCCGEAGRIIFLIHAGMCLNQPELYQAAAKATTKMIEFYEQQGFWKLQSVSARSIIPGLSDGVAGVGLALLTLLEPQKTSHFLTLS